MSVNLDIALAGDIPFSGCAACDVFPNSLIFNPFNGIYVNINTVMDYDTFVFSETMLNEMVFAWVIIKYC